MRTVAIFFISSLLSLALLADKSRADCVILLHGLARTSLSLALLDEVLKRHGYKTALIDYPSTTGTKKTCQSVLCSGALTSAEHGRRIS